MSEAVVQHGAVARPSGGGTMRRLNAGTAVVIGILFAVAAHQLASQLIADSPPQSDDKMAMITMIGWAVGFMTGIGALHGPWRWLLGRDQTHEDEMFLAGKDQGIGRYFRFTTDHKVVGIQYLVLTMVLLGTGGTLAMLIRTDLITPQSSFLGPQTYNAVVGLHGLVMILATIIMVTGPFGNFIVPIMIGARDMAFPRLNALSLWLIVAAVPVLYSTAFLGGIPTGWVGYAPLSDQGPTGMDSYLVTIVIFAVSSAIAGANITCTILTMRARGMTWNRTPIFVWGTMASVALAIPAFPMFMASMVLLGVDRSVGGQFYVASGGGSPWLYANLFWLMGHPEVYVIVIPAVAALMELTPVFARKPLFNYNAAVLAIVGIVGLSIMVWAHHMYASGWAPDLNGPFMLTTELISIPTGVLFLVVVGTIWRGRVWTTLPMMATYAMLWNFIIGGVTGIYLSDVPADYALPRLDVRDRALPLHAHGRRAHRRDRSPDVLVPQDDRAHAPSTSRFRVVLAGADRFQRHVHGNVRGRSQRPATTCRALRQHVRGRELRVHHRRLHDRRRHARAAVGRRQLVAQRTGRTGESLGLQDPRVDRAEPDPAGELRGPPDRHLRSLRLRRGGPGPRTQPGRTTACRGGQRCAPATAHRRGRGGRTVRTGRVGRVGR